jgi:hypothetical protein
MGRSRSHGLWMGAVEACPSHAKHHVIQQWNRTLMKSSVYHSEFNKHRVDL